MIASRSRSGSLQLGPSLYNDQTVFRYISFNTLSRSEFFLRLAKLTFQKAVRYQESENYKESLQLLHDNPDLKQKLKFALLHYHPDKQDLECQGLKWVVLTEEITVYLTDHLSRLKL